MGFKGLGFKGLGFKGLGFWGLRVWGLGWAHGAQASGVWETWLLLRSLNQITATARKTLFFTIYPCYGNPEPYITHITVT